MTVDLVNQLVAARETVHKEYCRYSAYLSVDYNQGYNVNPLNDDSQSTRLVLVNRGRKKLFNCLLLNQTWKILKKTKNIENVFFSNFAPGIVSNTMQLYSENVVRHVVAIDVSGECGHRVGDIDFRSDITPAFFWSGQQTFFSYNHSKYPRLVLVVDAWK